MYPNIMGKYNIADKFCLAVFGLHSNINANIQSPTALQDH